MDKFDREELYDLLLEDYSFEEVLEMVDVTPFQALEVLFHAGQIDEEILKGIGRYD